MHHLYMISVEVKETIRALEQDIDRAYEEVKGSQVTGVGRGI